MQWSQLGDLRYSKNSKNKIQENKETVAQNLFRVFPNSKQCKKDEKKTRNFLGNLFILNVARILVEQKNLSFSKFYFFSKVFHPKKGRKKFFVIVNSFKKFISFFSSNFYSYFPSLAQKVVDVNVFLLLLLLLFSLLISFWGKIENYFKKIKYGKAFFYF